MAEGRDSTGSQATTSSRPTRSWDHGSSPPMKSEIKPFDEVINFGLWQRRMRGVLVQQRLQIALLGITEKPDDMTDAEWADIDDRAISTIVTYITDKVLNNVIYETTAQGMWERLEELYQGKSLSNKLFLKALGTIP